jgi:hypothetical protein
MPHGERMSTYPRLVAAALSCAFSTALIAADYAGPKPAAGKGAATSTATKTEPEAEAKIEGFVIARNGGGFMGVVTQGATLTVTFYDAKKKKAAPEGVARVAVRWHDTKPRRAVLMPNGEATFISPTIFRPPYRYNATLVVVGAAAAAGAGASDNDEAPETEYLGRWRARRRRRRRRRRIRRSWAGRPRQHPGRVRSPDRRRRSSRGGMERAGVVRGLDGV